MSEMTSATGVDTAPYDTTSNSTTPPVGVERDAKTMLSSAIKDTNGQLDLSDSSQIPLERWNEPRVNKYRYFAALYGFVLMGMNDAASGVSTLDH